MTINTGALVEHVEELTIALRQAQEDAALLDRLSKARAEIKRLSPALEEAQEQLSQAMAAEVSERRAAVYAGYRDIKITETNTNEGILHRVFKITYTRDEWNGREAVPATYSVQGFGSLPDAAWGYLFNVRPDQIPLSILALSPEGDARDAFNTYFTGMKRGWLNGPVAA